MTTLHCSNRAEALLERLASDVAAHRAAKGPWEPVCLVAPNRNVQVWLQPGDGKGPPGGGPFAVAGNA